LTETFTIFAGAVAEMFGAARGKAEMIGSVRTPSVETVIVAVPLHAIIFEAITNLAIAFSVAAQESMRDWGGIPPVYSTQFQQQWP
jgi:hypothetical protein